MTRSLLAAGLLLLLTAACSVIPPAGFPPSDEREVEVFYDLHGAAADLVQVPASGTDVTVLWLEAQPPAARETFVGDRRLLHMQTEEVRIRCRYRAYAEGAATGEQHLPTPEQLFPGATSIRTLWRRGSQE